MEKKQTGSFIFVSQGKEFWFKTGQELAAWLMRNRPKLFKDVEAD